MAEAPPEIPILDQFRREIATHHLLLDSIEGDLEDRMRQPGGLTEDELRNLLIFMEEYRKYVEEMKRRWRRILSEPTGQ